jgi:quercetin dioxygenase-like cupin family protein
MEMQPKRPTVKAPAETFAGDAWYDVIARGTEPSRVRVNVVRFAPGARNAWHAHAVGQTIHVTEGVGRIQARGGEVLEVRPGDTIHTPPDRYGPSIVGTVASPESARSTLRLVPRQDR